MNHQLETTYKRIYPAARRVVATSTLQLKPQVYMARDAKAAILLRNELRDQHYDVEIQIIN